MRPGRLAGRVAVVTGAAGHLGSHAARAFAAEGASVVLVDRSDASSVAGEISAAGGAALFVETDLTDERSIAQLVATCRRELGPADVLLNNAALAQVEGTWEEIDRAEWERVMDVNLTATFLVTRALLPDMRAAGYGRIVNMSSGTVVLGLPRLLHYITSKAGVIGFTRALASEVGAFGVTVNAIITGLYPHERVKGVEEMVSAVVPMQAIPRPGRPEDLTPALTFLASEEARWITGQSIAVDGGLVRAGG